MRFTMAFILGLVLVVMTVPAKEPASSLRMAISDLTSTFGESYSHGQDYLKQLDSIEQRMTSDNPAERQSAQSDREKLHRNALIANPLVSRQPILFVVRQQYARDHHNTETMFENGQYIDGRFTPGGALKTFDPLTGKITTLVDANDGVIRDPEVHFSGKKIVFSMRRNQADSYHIYEIRTDGTGLKQLTFAKNVSDIDPMYLPDDTIVFASTRDPKVVPCNKHVCANLFAMEADGANIHQISKNTLFEGHPSLMSDGRILYDRWEYVDRAFGDAQGLWTARPDGTNHALYWGNNTPSPGGVIDPREIPGTNQVVCVMATCHDRPWGVIAIINRQMGLDGRAPVAKTWPANGIDFVRDPGTANEAWDFIGGCNPKYEDPYPLSDKYFLCSRTTGNGEQMGIYLIDVFGNELQLCVDGPGCFDPMPIASRPRPATIPMGRNFANKEGAFYIDDVYLGTHMDGIKRGTVKYLRVVETPPKVFRTIEAWGGQGIECPGVNWHDFMCKKILGTVPVEADGSVYFKVPSERFVYFQLLNENKMMVQSMRSGAYVQSGETTGCVGCHDDRRIAPPSQRNKVATAMRHKPSTLDGWYGPERNFSYMAEVQPVFDKHCVRCHDYGKHAGMKLNLARDKDLVFNTSYNELWRKGFIKAVGAGPAETQQPYKWGSHASPLVKTLLAGHKNVSLSKEEMDHIITWVDINGPYYPQYATAYPDSLGGRCPLNFGQLDRLQHITGLDIRGSADCRRNPGPLVSFDRPELSPCLAAIKDKTSDAYKEALSIIRSGQEALKAKPDADMPGFVACSADQERGERYLQRSRTEALVREAIRNKKKIYDER